MTRNGNVQTATRYSSRRRGPGEERDETETVPQDHQRQAFSEEHPVGGPPIPFSTCACEHGLGASDFAGAPEVSLWLREGAAFSQAVVTPLLIFILILVLLTRNRT